MRHTIVILTQQVDNASVQMIRAALSSTLHGTPYKLHVVAVKTAELTQQGIKIALAHSLWQSSLIPFAEIALVMKRTWGPVRSKALVLCRGLEKQGITVLNGCDYIELTHHKIAQYQHEKLHALFPRSVCFDAAFVATAKGMTDYGCAHVLQQIAEQGLCFPLVFKTSQGCRTDGVYRVDTVEELHQLLGGLFLQLTRNPVHSELTHGLLLQQFIQTDASDIDLAEYYRINLVAGRAQSAMQFQLRWESTTGGYKKLREFREAIDKPIELSFFSEHKLRALEEQCGCPEGVIGVDVLSQQDQFHVLEFNDGPAVSVIVDVAKKNLHAASQTATQACLDFPNAIAAACKQVLLAQLDHAVTTDATSNFTP